MIKNVVFDIENVLVKFEPDLFLKERYSDEKVMELIYSTIFKDKVWLGLT